MSISLIDEAADYVFKLFKEKLSHQYVYHNYQHTYETVEACKKLSAHYQLSQDEKEDLLLAAWFHDTGYVYAYEGHEDKSREMAKLFLEEKGVPAGRIETIISCIGATKRQVEPSSLIEQILCDADISSTGSRIFFSRAELLREEWDNFNIGVSSDLEWERTQFKFLSEVNYHTSFAQELYGIQLSLNLHEQRAKLKKIEKKEAKRERELAQSKAQPKRGIETMFRSIYHMHINLSAIADNKANMMIHINSIIISVMMGIVGAKFSFLGTSFKQTQKMIIPVISLLVTGIFSIIFAILSAKPKITNKIASCNELQEAKNVNILFFGNFSNLTIEEFELQMKELMKSEDLLYGNMIKDLYYLGKVLTNKYRLLKYSYLCFMIGLIITVLLTLFIIMYLRKQAHQTSFL